MLFISQFKYFDYFCSVEIGTDEKVMPTVSAKGWNEATLTVVK